MTQGPGVIWIKAAVAYFIMGTALGIYMGASGDHVLTPVHAHFNLLGWASLALVGLIYRQFPVAGSHWMATVQFWLHNAGLLAAQILAGRYPAIAARVKAFRRTQTDLVLRSPEAKGSVAGLPLSSRRSRRS